MKYRHITDGFALIELVVAALVLAIVGFGGYYVYTAQMQLRASSAEQSSQSNSGNNSKTSTSTNMSSSNNDASPKYLVISQ